MRWSYLVGHILTTFILSPFVAFLLKIISNILESGEINSFSGTDINQAIGGGDNPRSFFYNLVFCLFLHCRLLFNYTYNYLHRCFFCLKVT